MWTLQHTHTHTAQGRHRGRGRTGRPLVCCALETDSLSVVVAWRNCGMPLGKAPCACAKAALDLKSFQLQLRNKVIRVIDAVLPSASDGDTLVAVLKRALADAEAEDLASKKAEKEAARAAELARAEAAKAEAQAAKAMEDAAKALAKARAKEEAARRRASAIEAKGAAEAAAKEEAMQRAVAKEELKHAERVAKAEAETRKQTMKAEAMAQKQAAKQAVAEAAAERKAAADSAKLEAERIKSEASEIARREQAEAGRASDARASSSAAVVTQQRLERSQNRLAGSLFRRGSHDHAQQTEQTSAFNLLGIAARRHSAAKAIEEDNARLDSQDGAATRSDVVTVSQLAASWEKAWSKGATRSLELAVSTDCMTLYGVELICCGAVNEQNSITVYSLADREILLTFSGHSERVCSLATVASSENADDHYLIVSGSRDKTIRIWSRMSGGCLGVVHGSSDAVLSLSARHGWLLSGEGSSHPGAITKARLWTWGSGALEALDDDEAVVSFNHKSTFEHSGPIWGVALTDQVAVTASDDSTARIWPLQGASSRSLATLQHPAWVCSVSLQRHDGLCATGCGDSVIRLWSLRSTTAYACLCAIKHCDGSSNTYPMRVRWAEHGGSSALVSSGMDDKIRCWSIERDGTANCVTTLSAGTNVRGLSVSTSSLVLASSGGGKSKSVTIWQPHLVA